MPGHDIDDTAPEYAPAGSFSDDEIQPNSHDIAQHVVPFGAHAPLQINTLEIKSTITQFRL